MFDEAARPRAAARAKIAHLFSHSYDNSDIILRVYDRVLTR
jgi:hypothetical protein